MKRRLKAKTKSHRVPGATGSDATGVRSVAETVTTWRTRRVPLRKASDQQVGRKIGTKEPTPMIDKGVATREPKGHLAAFQRILVPIDFSMHSTRALKFAAALAERHASSVMLVHVVGAIHDLRDFGYAKERLSALAQNFLPANLEWEPVVRSGNGTDQILKEAEEMKADLIVMSTRGLSATPPSKIGNIAKRIVRHSPCPVLILPGRKETKANPATKKTL
jgi:nucleotide-binding universal stress UspA family protein